MGIVAKYLLWKRDWILYWTYADVDLNVQFETLIAAQCKKRLRLFWKKVLLQLLQVNYLRVSNLVKQNLIKVLNEYLNLNTQYATSGTPFRYIDLVFSHSFSLS